MNKEEKEAKIQELEAAMNAPDFWADKNRAQAIIKEIQELKDEILGGGKYDSGHAVMTIFSGAGGDDAEDFSRILFDMYSKFLAKKGWEMAMIHRHENNHGGFRNISFDIKGKGAYGILKNESGVHRLVRISPFDSNKRRHTSFSLVEVIPKFSAQGGPASGGEMEIPSNELKIEHSKSGGPGGQNVNKRETAIRLIHIPTKISVHVDTERSQAQNQERAMALLQGKLYKMREDERMAKEKGMYISKTTDIEWGSQIRSYVLHPYKMVKDHRTEAETSDVDGVLNGDLEMFLEAEKNI